MKKIILSVDDDKEMHELLGRILTPAGYTLLKTHDAAEAFEALEDTKPDLILRDLSLPDIGGIEICRKLREDPKTQAIPIIMLTHLGEIKQKTRGLDIGADDYITKPFEQTELLSRINALLRRQGLKEAPEGVFKSGTLLLYPDRREVFVGKEKIALTLKEFDLLHLLMKRRGKAVSRENLLESVWGFSYIENTRTLDVHIRYLRRKLGNQAKKIETVGGVGYKFSE